MNALPKHRSATTGRTFSRSWSASDFDPISHYPRSTGGERALGVVLAIVIGITGAALLVHWAAS